MAIDRIVVVVPAHDEELLIGRCLEAVGRATRRVEVPVEVRVVLDSCTDRTQQRIPYWVETRHVQARCVGAARAAGLADVLAGEDASEQTWCATTDADSVVPEHWLTTQLVSARRHDVFVGTVTPTDHELRGAGLLTRFERDYQRRAGHRHVHGANLGFSARAYRLVGGFEHQCAHEDVRLVRAAEELGLRLDWSGRASVQTSVRSSARVPHGYSRSLDHLASRPLNSCEDHDHDRLVLGPPSTDQQQEPV